MEMLRSLLFVPADSPRKIAKAKTLQPDAFIFDLEDAVAMDRKLEARAALSHELASLKSPNRIFVRVNGIRTKFFEEDLRAAVDPAVDGLFLPKCDDPEALVRVDNEITRIEGQKGVTRGKTKLLLILETALGVVRAYELGRASERVTVLNFGAEDYCADMGMQRTRAGEEVAIPRMLVSQAAHAARLTALDGVFTDFNDEAGLIEDTRRGQKMGYTGRALIHPNQILPVNRAFAPAEEEVSWATEVVRAFDDAKAKGSGLVVVRGKMVDEPVVVQARRILRQRDADGKERSAGT
jgi:citrate lyase subunit beta / citryl-CoA lyase